ncbi:hypothetical protein [Natrialba asiatica]|uniref:C2H2-type domain-containing protein n=1 Tax=Natrialba asiatica (strain ATCC 700177 / DSM 12278 / JCM 9576 / FERM P-10747 / NBRC 102637 / 172P1) TaxID=29540 RepID=M0AQQ4_NATA1|nr:hypothetical protein [Natrialba asiatica]ELZ00652.1 hypothetical protein C481_13449 [Natrialba asiatica DSM 12278]
MQSENGSADATDAPIRCPDCGQPFHTQRLQRLHRGLEHPDELADRERAAVEYAYHEETAAIRRFRLLALGAVLLLYFCTLFLYAAVT